MAIYNKRLSKIPDWKETKDLPPPAAPRRRSNKDIKDSKNIFVATALSDGNSSLNNELNVKLDYNSIVRELKGNGIHLNKTLSKPYKKASCLDK